MPTARIVSPSQKTRKTQVLGRKLSVESIHRAIEKGMAECQKCSGTECGIQKTVNKKRGLNAAGSLLS